MNISSLRLLTLEISAYKVGLWELDTQMVP